MLNDPIPHAIVEGNFLAAVNISHSNEIITTGFIEPNATVRVTTMVNAAIQATMLNEGIGTHLCGMGMVGGYDGDNFATHDGLSSAEGSGRIHTFPFL